MSDTPETLDFNLDIDLESIDTPFATVKDGTYTIQLNDIELSQSKTKRPMLRCKWTTTHPETNEVISIRDFPLLDRQDGKFRLRQILTAAGQPISRLDVPTLLSLLPACVGVQVEAELNETESDDFGTQNNIRRLLVAVK